MRNKTKSKESSQEPRQYEEKEESTTTKDEMKNTPKPSSAVKEFLVKLQKSQYQWVWVFVMFFCLFLMIFQAYLIGSAEGRQQGLKSLYSGHFEEGSERYSKYGHWHNEEGERTLSFSYEGDQDSFGDRLLIHTGRMTLSSFKDNLDNLESTITNLTKTEGEGYVEAKSSKIFPHFVRTVLDLRVAGNKFHTVVDSICKLAVVQELSIRSKDVTDQFLDSSSESETLLKSVEALRSLLSEATTVNDVMAVQKELMKSEREYERLNRGARSLKKKSDLSRLRVTLLLEEPRSEESLPNPIQLALSHLKVVYDSIRNFIMYVTVWLIPFVVVILLASFWVKSSGGYTTKD
mmetsp:Transcript_2389/g.3349  ORF Transcript_2389/g.3349 Transcript_2389/m.3349 type:complete len:348 (+) Transcript_2389:56-1099(+)